MCFAAMLQEHSSAKGSAGDGEVSDCGRVKLQEALMAIAASGLPSGERKAAARRAVEVHLLGCAALPEGHTVWQPPSAELEEVLAHIKRVGVMAGTVRIEDGKSWLRSLGPRGSKAASALGKLSGFRNSQCHPTGKQLRVEIDQILVDGTAGVSLVEQVVDQPAEPKEAHLPLVQHGDASDKIENGKIVVDVNAQVVHLCTVGETDRCPQDDDLTDAGSAGTQLFDLFSDDGASEVDTDGRMSSRVAAVDAAVQTCSDSENAAANGVYVGMDTYDIDFVGTLGSLRDKIHRQLAQLEKAVQHEQPIQMVEAVLCKRPVGPGSIDDVRAKLNAHLAHASGNMTGLKVFGVEVDFNAGRYEVIATYEGSWNKQSANKLHELVISSGGLDGCDVEVFGVARRRGRRHKRR